MIEISADGELSGVPWTVLSNAFDEFVAAIRAYSERGFGGVAKKADWRVEALRVGSLGLLLHAEDRQVAESAFVAEVASAATDPGAPTLLPEAHWSRLGEAFDKALVAGVQSFSLQNGTAGVQLGRTEVEVLLGRERRLVMTEHDQFRGEILNVLTASEPWRIVVREEGWGQLVRTDIPESLFPQVRSNMRTRVDLIGTVWRSPHDSSPVKARIRTVRPVAPLTRDMWERATTAIPGVSYDAANHVRRGRG